MVFLVWSFSCACLVGLPAPRRSELQRYIPRSRAHAIVVLTTPTPSAAATSAAPRLLHGFDLSAGLHGSVPVVLLAPLPPRALAKVFASIAGVEWDRPAAAVDKIGRAHV